MNRSSSNASQPQGGAVTCPPCQMTRPVRFSARLGPMAARLRRGYTIVELLMATLLTLILMYAVVRIFGSVAGTVSESRSTLEMTDRLRAAKERLRQDLEWLTVTVWPPRRPETNEGYFEYIEGALGPKDPVWTVDPSTTFACDEDTGEPDTTVGDFDDILLFTARSRGAPFIGRYGNSTFESYEAEIAWFVRGGTLYRRVLLIAPQTLSELDVRPLPADGGPDGVVSQLDLDVLFPAAGPNSFFNFYDISARPAVDSSGNLGWIPNTLGDLTKRENRFAHRLHATLDRFPYSAGRWGQLGLPTLRECSHPDWMTWNVLGNWPQVTPVTQIDLWNTPHPWVDTSTTPATPQVDRITGTLLNYMGPRIAEDVILTNVIGFDVKIWDPGAPILRGVDDAGTPSNLADDAPLPNVTVEPGDPGYPLALAHFLEEWAKAPGARQQEYLPISYGAYVDLDYPAYAVIDYGVPSSYSSPFSGPAEVRSQLTRVYDTWSFHYEQDGISQDDDDGDGNYPGDPDDPIDEGTDGFDSDGDGVVDDIGEMETMPPYPFRPRGIQVKIRCFEPDSRQVREVTVVVDFLTK